MNKTKICINSLKGTCDGSRKGGFWKCNHCEPHIDHDNCGESSYFSDKKSIPRRIGYNCFSKNPRCIKVGSLEYEMLKIIKEYEGKDDKRA